MRRELTDGVARDRTPRRGMGKHGKALHGMALRGMARHRKARHGAALCGVRCAVAARAGAALSMRAVTGIPIKMLGVREPPPHAAQHAK
jgi:hypothetical protein